MYKYTISVIKAQQKDNNNVLMEKFNLELQQAIDILSGEVIARFKGKVTYTSNGVKIGDKYVSDLIDKPLLDSMGNPEISISIHKMKG